MKTGLLFKTADYSTETLKVRRAWKDVIQSLKDHNTQPRSSYTAEIAFKTEKKMKTF